MSWNSALTERGAALLASAIDTSFYLTKITLGSGITTDDLKNQISLINEKATATSVKVYKSGDSCNVTYELKNKNIENEFELQQVGIWAKQNESDDDVLYMILQDDSDKPTIIKSENDSPGYTYAATINIVVGSSEVLNATINEAGTAKYDEVFDENGMFIGSKLKNTVVSFSESTNLTEIYSTDNVSTIFGKAKKAIKELISHIAKKDNPHVITKEQIGAMGFKRTLTSEDDMNNIKEDGIYAYSTNTVTQGLKNAPFSNAAVMMVFGSTSTSSQKIQLAFRYGAAGQAKFRALFENKWQEWSEFAVATDGIVAVANGGTGASTAAAARANLGAAASGFGYGDEMTYLTVNDDTFNTEIKKIFAKMSDGSAMQIQFEDWQGLSGTTFIGTLWRYDKNNGTLDAVSNLGYSARKCLRNGTWQPWEWINPPMLLDVEYRTVERYNGKPVYCMLTEIGAFPNAAETNIYPAIENVSLVVEWHAVDRNKATNIEKSEIIKSLTVSNECIHIVTVGDGSKWYVRFSLKYTKTTD